MTRGWWPQSRARLSRLVVPPLTQWWRWWAWHIRWSVACGEGAVSVADDQGGPDRGGDDSSGAADVEGFAVGAEDRGDDLGVAGQPAQGGGRQLVGRRVCEALGQLLEGDGDVESCGCAVGVRGQAGVQPVLGGRDQGVPQPGTGVAGVVHDFPVLLVDGRGGCGQRQ
jgi:hypothetical protein